MSREERIARNEALFREVNEQIKDVNDDVPAGSEAGFVCECGDPECTSTVSLTLVEYEEVRSEPTHFVGARTERFAAVRKNEPQAARIAVREDPRS